ncbi:Major facilitator superfamily domain general substrate transporter [Penicillium manginii]|uniref:Major facilitator superfamily domain general substrate transporter n=1 Tax=Penicillium manginii TaxID=203109 RepID=UPI002547F80B|nr:Major facilitator superfamily domain general substrate transporter [Penicillium manginii]KAJ5750730.1 Major facilitator superfamily domain general substrate transporter [Penicillium manginii]
MDHSKSLSATSDAHEEQEIALCHESEIKDIGEENGLPPMDGGFHAWMFLAASTMIEALTWGFAFAFGVFQSYYRDNELFEDSGMVAAIGTCATGAAYLCCPCAIVCMILLPRLARWFSTIGLVIMCFSLAMGSFSSNVTHLVLSQGIGFGIGGCIAYSPSILFMTEWFDKKRGLAFGIVWAGSGLSGILFPIVLDRLLGQFGFRTTLRILSGVLFVLPLPFLYFHKPRLPIQKGVAHRRLTTRFLSNRVFVIYQVVNIFEALGFFLPGIYLPSFARYIGVSEFLSSITVTTLNLASIFGSISMGFLSDRCSALTCVSISTIGTTLSVFLLWGFSTQIPLLLVFCVAYGIFAGSFSAIWSAIIREVQKVDKSADATIIFSAIAFGRGIGNVVSGPFSEMLLNVDNWQGYARGAYGSGFGLIIVCTGLTSLMGVLCWIARAFKCI